jgi:DHA1 family tetracycline resistance protein-like MFS transporter
MTNLFAYFTKPSAPFQFAGAPFLLAAVLILISTVVAFITLKNDKYTVAKANLAVNLEEA